MKNTVLYLYGTGRSGTTLLARILGQMEGFVCVGELRWAWEQGFLGNHLCGCGVLFKECGFWRAVAQEAFGSFEQADTRRTREMTSLYPWNRARPKGESVRYIPQLILGQRPPGYVEQFQEYSGILGSLYQAIQKVSGSRVIVDSSKDPSYAYLLNALPDVNLRLLHVVRDSRAVTFSWMRSKASPEVPGREVYLPRLSPLKTSLSWLSHNNLFVTALKRQNPNYLCLRYEDVIDSPREAVRRILDFVQEGGEPLEITSHHTVDLKPDHTVSGNPMRFDQGPIKLKPDDEWKTRMTSVDKAIVTGLTWPGLLKYGYFGRRTKVPATEQTVQTETEDLAPQGRGEL